MKKSINYLKLALLMASQVVIFIILVLTDNFYYMTNDDTTMVAIASGAYGAPSAYVVNLHVLLGWVLKSLFSVAPVINWMTVILLVSSFLAFFAIDVLLCFAERGKRNIVRTVGIIAIVDVAWFMLISYFTFTVVAYTVGIAAMAAYLYSFADGLLHKEKKGWRVAGIVLLFLCSLIRAEVLKSLLIVIAPVSVYMIIKGQLKKVILIFAVPLVIMVGLTISHTWIYNMNPVQKDFLNWGEIRSAAVDSSVIDFTKFESEFAELGVDQDVYQMIYNQYYFDWEPIDVEVFSGMTTMRTLSEKYNLNIISVLKQVMMIGTDFLNYEAICLPIMLILGMLAIITDIKHWRETILILLGGLLANVVFCVINRPVYRVVMPNYIFVYVLLAMQIENNSSAEKKGSIRGLNFGIMLTSVVLLLTVGYSFSHKNPVHFQDKITRHNTERQQIYKYLEDHNDKLYFSGNLSVYSIDVCRPPFDFAGRNGYLWNLVGNWETFSVPYYNLMEHYEVSNPNRLAIEAPDSEVIRIISNQGLSYIDYAAFFVNYIEKQTGKNVQIVPEDHIAELPDGDWWSFRIVTE